MNDETWHDYFDDDPFERVGRHIKGTLGELRAVSMYRINWAYLDWMEENHGGNVENFFIENELVWRPEFGTLDEFLEGAVRTTFLRSEREGKSRPPWCAAASPAEYLDS